MRCEVYTDIECFAKDVLSWVKEYETQNNLLLSNINGELRGGKANDLKIAVKDEEGEVVLVGVQVNPYNLTLAEKDNKVYEGAIELLVKTLYEQKISIPGCIAVEDLADRFSIVYTKYFQKERQNKMGLNLLQAQKIKPLNGASGRLRLATKEDLFYLPHWGKEFSMECGIHVETVQDYYKKFSACIETNRLYIWEDTIPMSVCMQGRSGEKGAGISFVYTPPYYRNKGYATECVAYASQAILDKGFDHCYLFADQANPISNKVYMRIGYQMMGLTKEICFV